VHSYAFVLRNVDALFFMLRWDRYGFHKTRSGTHYTELVFLHPVGYVGHVVHSGASGAQNMKYYFLCSGGPNAVFIKMRWDKLRRTCVFASGGIWESRSAFWCIQGAQCQHTIFHARVGPVRF
jgi:hypothetical protein